MTRSLLVNNLLDRVVLEEFLDKIGKSDIVLKGLYIVDFSLSSEFIGNEDVDKICLNTFLDVFTRHLNTGYKTDDIYEHDVLTAIEDNSLTASITVEDAVKIKDTYKYKEATLELKILNLINVKNVYGINKLYEYIQGAVKTDGLIVYSTNNNKIKLLHIGTKNEKNNNN